LRPLAVAAVDRARVDLQKSAIGMLPFAFEKFIELKPRRFVVRRTPEHVVTENAIRAVETAVALSGNPGLSRSSPLERHLRDVLCARVHTPQNDSVLKSAGLAALRAQAET